MGEIVFVGLGLHDERDISLRGLEDVEGAKVVFIERYTSLMSGFSVKRFEKISGRRLHFLSRRDLEEGNAEPILEVAGTGKAVLLVPGDPLIATTHVALRIQAEKKGICTRIVHGASILSAVIGLSGLHNYKFGKSVTIPFLQSSETPYDVVSQNIKLGLHTLCLLDVDSEKNGHMRISKGLEFLLEIEEKRREKVLTNKTLVVGIARAGSEDPIVKADFLEKLLDYDFGLPPHSIIFPGSLHFMEAEALIVLAGGPECLRRNIV